jgi:isopentenyl diphosphate isomerase/L-lactate dehydrogenase-like FMN-dependent dehydrogenase
MRLTRFEALAPFQARMAPVQELLNAFEFETAARRKLDGAAFEEIAGGDRAAFDRMTFRPRLMINTTRLDLTLDLFGQSMFAPIIVGPTAEQKRFHPDGELAMARGASAAKAAMVISSRCSYPVEQIAAQAKTALWYQVYPEADMAARAQEAVKLGCKAICLTLGMSKEAGVDWTAIDRLRQTVGVPVLLKGIMNPEEARSAVQRGVQGIVVSNYTGRAGNAAAAPIEMLPAVVEAVAGKAPVLIDGGFRRGSDVLKALALGARAVLLGRPVLWALVSYGAEGVQRLLELLQTELARDMAMCGKPNLGSIDRAMVKVHRS